MKNDIELSVAAVVNGVNFETTVTNPSSEEDAKDQIIDNFLKEFKDADSFVECSGFDVVEWGILEDYDNLQDLDTVYDIVDNDPLYDMDVVSAAVACDIELSDINESYVGHFRSDEDFAEDTAKEICNIPTEWPYYCIDWEHAARELMHDYCEENGHYFRVL